MEMEVTKYVLGILQLVVTAWCVHLYNSVNKAAAANEEAARQLAAHKLHVAEMYMTKSDSTRAFDSLTRTLDSLISTMNNRFDRMDSKLDSKMDKGD